MTQPETDLALIDAALAEGRVTTADPAERELQELALALRADSPEPRPAFADELARAGAGGLPAHRAARRPRAGRAPAPAPRGCCRCWPRRPRC